MKDKKQATFVSILLLGVVLCIVMYMYYYKPTLEKTQSLENSNKTLQERVTTLEQFYAEMPQNKQEIQDMTNAIKTDLDVFPADVLEEDTIYFALQSMRLSNLQKLYDDNVVASDERIEIPVAEEGGSVVSFESISISAKDVLASVDAQLVADSQIEGYEGNVNFEKRSVDYANVTTYPAMKALVQAINSDPEKKTISKISYNSDKDGLLSGVVSVTFYSVTGTGKEYQPKELSDYMIGLDNLFAISTIEQ